MTEPTFNLWTEPWIAVESEAGDIDTLSLADTLTQAHQYRSLYDPSPLVMVGIHRLLVAILQDALNPQIEDDLADIWEAGHFSTAEIVTFGDKYAHRFDLFSKTEPFMQSADLPISPWVQDKNINYAARLMYEIPTSGDIVHYHHGNEEMHAFCPHCVAKGLIMLSSFAKADGRGYGTPPTGMAPIYIFPEGKNLFESLTLSLIVPELQPRTRNKDDLPWWEHPVIVDKSKELYRLGYLQSLTLPVRQVRLHPENIKTTCTQCGDITDWCVRTINWAAGEKYAGDVVWIDPFVAYREPTMKSNKDIQPTPVRLSKGKAVWRDYAALFLRSTNKYHRQPAVLRQLAILQDHYDFDEVDYHIRCISFRGDKAKVLEWLDAKFDLPLSLLDDLEAGIVVQDAIDFATKCNSIIESKFNKFFKGGSKKSSRHQRSKSNMSQALWYELAQPFSQFISGLVDVDIREQLANNWLDTVVSTSQIVFKEAVESLGNDAGNLRRRVQSKAECDRSLFSARKKAKENIR